MLVSLKWYFMPSLFNRHTKFLFKKKKNLSYNGIERHYKRQSDQRGSQKNETCTTQILHQIFIIRSLLFTPSHIAKMGKNRWSNPFQSPFLSSVLWQINLVVKSKQNLPLTIVLPKLMKHSLFDNYKKYLYENSLIWVQRLTCTVLSRSMKDTWSSRSKICRTIELEMALLCHLLRSIRASDKLEEVWRSIAPCVILTNYDKLSDLNA